MHFKFTSIIIFIFTMSPQHSVILLLPYTKDELRKSTKHWKALDIFAIYSRALGCLEFMKFCNFLIYEKATQSGLLLSGLRGSVQVPCPTPLGMHVLSMQRIPLGFFWPCFICIIMLCRKHRKHSSLSK